MLDFTSILQLRFLSIMEFLEETCCDFVQASFQRSNSHDKVRKIVAEEGRTARNLIAWSVPLENKEEEGMYIPTPQHPPLPQTHTHAHTVFTDALSHICKIACWLFLSLDTVH